MLIVMSGQPVSITEIAAGMGVSVAAVSYALRGKRGVSEQLRRRIVDYAKSRGYQPDPLNAELMSLVRAKRRLKKSGNTIAYINTYSVPSLAEQESLFCQGARERARDFGYEMEVFMARTPGMTSARLTQILKARGIRGVLIGTRLRDDPEFVFDCSGFSTVLVGETESHQHVHRVSTHQSRMCAQTLHKLVEKGYRRIGLVLAERYEKPRGYAISLGADRFMRETGHRDRVLVYYTKEFDRANEGEGLLQWCLDNRIDAVVSLARDAGCFVTRWNAEGRAIIGYACLSVMPHTRLTSDYAQWQHLWSGIDQHYAEIGATAMEYLRGLLLDGKRGPSRRPHTILVDGEWIEGQTTPGPGIAFRIDGFTG